VLLIIKIFLNKRKGNCPMQPNHGQNKPGMNIFLTMTTAQVIGFDLHACHCRKGRKAFYYHQKFQGTGRNLMMLILKGSAFFEFEKAKVIARRGHFLVYESTEIKSVRGAPEAPPSYILAEFDLWGRSGNSIGITSLGLPLCSKLKNFPSARSLMMKMEAACGRGKEKNLLECSRLGLALLQTVAEEPPAGPLQPAGEYQDADERITGVLEYVRSHYKEKFTVHALAQKARIHPVYFTRLFKRTTGMTPHQYILQVKIEKAKAGLAEFNEPLHVTGTDLGFSDYSHFYRAFSKATGNTPSEYRRNHRA
jgi:AraC-like DNA-binding protein